MRTASDLMMRRHGAAGEHGQQWIGGPGRFLARVSRFNQDRRELGMLHLRGNCKGAQ